MKMLAKRTIPDPVSGEPYLVRFTLIECRYFAIHLHRILLPDGARDLHDHPWSFFSIVLWGGYVEEFLDGLPEISRDKLFRRYMRMPVEPKTRSIRWWNYHGMHSAHRITLVRPRTWTLVFCGMRVRRWGFLRICRYTWGSSLEWIYWVKYLKVYFGIDVTDEHDEAEKRP